VQANAALEEALRAWREVEQANNPRRRFKEVDSDSDKASTSMSGSKSVGFMGLSVETGGGSSSCDEHDFGSISCPVRISSYIYTRMEDFLCIVLCISTNM